MEGHWGSLLAHLLSLNSANVCRPGHVSQMGAGMGAGGHGCDAHQSVVGAASRQGVMSQSEESPHREGHCGGWTPERGLSFPVSRCSAAAGGKEECAWGRRVGTCHALCVCKIHIYDHRADFCLGET